LVHASPRFELALEGGLAPFDSKRVIGDLRAVAKIEADAFVVFFGGVSSYSNSDPYKSVFAEGLQAAFLFPVDNMIFIILSNLHNLMARVSDQDPTSVRRLV